MLSTMIEMESFDLITSKTNKKVKKLQISPKLSEIDSNIRLKFLKTNIFFGHFHAFKVK